MFTNFIDGLLWNIFTTKKPNAMEMSLDFLLRKYDLKMKAVQNTISR